MLVPLSWLREFAPTDMDPDALADLLIPRGVLIEAIERPWSGLQGVVVAQVVEVRDHPNADTLCVARIRHADGEVELVVGVRNMREGDLVPWAPPGSRVPALTEPLAVRPVRGVDSPGMLCSPRELAISQDHGGILLLNGEGVAVGDDLKASLGLDEVVFDIEIEPNRPDFLSVLGVAREVAAATGVPLTRSAVDMTEIDETTADVVAITIEDRAACPRYVARAVRGAAHRPAPLRTQARLTACGVRPIDAIVDATNHTMLEVGQPLHAFDLQRLAGPGIVVRKATDGERLSTLDGVERTLTADDLLICDVDQPVAIAGVMGGQTSEVSEETSDVLLESASFARGGILLTARRLDLHTEASHRFERGVDPEGCEDAATRCAALMVRWAGGQVLRGSAHDGEAPPRRWVGFRPARATTLLGYEVTPRSATEVFETLGLRTRADGDRIDVEVPGYRPDIEREVDLIEEVVRVQGYGKVGTTLPRAPHAGGLPEPYAFARRVKEGLARAGLHEIRPVPFASEADLSLFDDRDAVVVTNPLRVEEGFLRTRLTPGLLRAVALNRARGVQTVRLFEVGTTFRAADPFVEVGKAGFAISGPAVEGWSGERRELDVLDAKGILEGLLDALGVRGWTLGQPPQGPFHPGRSAVVSVGDAPAGVIGEIHPRVAAAFEIEGRVAVCVVGLGPLLRAADREVEFHDIPRYPPVRRDLAFLVPEVTPAGTVHRVLRDAGGPLLDASTLFDVYVGDRIPRGTKSLAFSVDLRASDRTLTDDEAQRVVDGIVERLASELDAQLRTG
jgi:phenylalanyl-tRNA synthetase beta chain